MHDYFKSWPRKVGVVTLLLTCTLTVGWIRSRHTADELLIKVSDQTMYWFISSGEWLGWAVVSADQGLPSAYWTYQASKVFRHGGIEEGGPFEKVPYAWNWNECPHVIVPHYVLVIPMTLLSALLLFSTPRKSKRAAVWK